LTDWDLTALSVQLGYILPSKYVAVKKIKLMTVGKFAE